MDANTAMNEAIQTQTIDVIASDGQVLVAKLYGSAQPVSNPYSVLVAGALGIEQRYYAAFCAWLAGRGHAVMSFDLRGIGASLPTGQSLRDVQASMLSWARVDFTAAVESLCNLAGTDQVLLLGHSLGAQHPGMSVPSTQKRIRKLVSVASGSGYWRDWKASSRRAAPLMFYAAGPVLTPLFGYFPGKRLGMVGNLPRGVMAQFSHWCRHPEFAWGAEPQEVLPSLRSATYPIHAVSFSDDETMTETCTRQLFAAHPNAPCHIEVISPQQMGVARVGHIGAFRPQMQERLWPYLEACLLKA
jgi:predicted alpha/beta hydrolase